jgi:gamma-glutamyltranspeptidase/glutathione hydrolase
MRTHSPNSWRATTDTIAHMKSILVLLLPLSVSLTAWAADPAPVASRQGLVVTAQHLASEVGAGILRRGGNAVDAAVAVGYALAVVYPQAGNLGGGGFMTLRLADGRKTFIDFREKAPLAATETMFQDKNGQVVPGLSTDSWLSVATPGSPAGLEYARVKYGSMGRTELMAPAIRLAREGFTIGQGDAGVYQIATAELAKDPIGGKIFFKDGRPLQQGDRLVQPQLAQSLKLISERGPEAAFYRGPIGAAIAAASRAGGGILSARDFEHYQVRELAPVECDYRGFHLISAPPPSSGGVMICEILQILQGYDLPKMGFHSADEVHYLVEAMRRAYADRRDLGDPQFVSNPTAELLSPGHIEELRAGIDPVRATPSAALHAAGASPREGTNTTQFSIADSAGNAVSVTYTLNNWFGAQHVAGDTGILMNDEMDDFTSKPGVPNMFGLIQGAANAVQPGKTPLSSMSPTIVTKNDKLVMVIGSPGGSRIITITLEAIINVIDHGMTIQEAIDAPRIHHQWMPDKVYLERQALSPDTRALLISRGYTFSDAGYWGIAEGVLVGGPSLAGHDGMGEDGFLPLNALPAAGEEYFGAHDVRSGAGQASSEEGLPVQ